MQAMKQRAVEPVAAAACCASILADATSSIARAACADSRRDSGVGSCVAVGWLGTGKRERGREERGIGNWGEPAGMSVTTAG